MHRAPAPKKGRLLLIGYAGAAKRGPMKQIKVPKLYFYLLMFGGLWSFGIAIDLIYPPRLPLGVVETALWHNLVYALAVTLVLYFSRGEKKDDN